MNQRPLILTASLTLASAFSISSAGAATIDYAGVQFGVEDSTTNTLTTGWRNPTPAKPLDIDGDNILGSDGYLIYFNRISNPSYATIATTGYINRNNASVFWDDPTDPTGADFTAGGFYHDASAGHGVMSGQLLSFVITNPLPVGETLRLGVLFDVTELRHGQLHRHADRGWFLECDHPGFRLRRSSPRCGVFRHLLGERGRHLRHPSHQHFGLYS